VVELNGSGSSDTVNIYAGGQRIARDIADNAIFEHHNPVTGSWVTSLGHSNYRTTNREERDLRGAEIPTSSPYAWAEGYSEWKFGSLLYTDGGDPFDYSSGLTLDGLPVSENQLGRMMDSGAAITGLFVNGQMVGSWDFSGHSNLGMSGSALWLPETEKTWVDGGDDLNLAHDDPDDGIIRTWTDETNGYFMTRIKGYRAVGAASQRNKSRKRQTRGGGKGRGRKRNTRKANPAPSGPSACDQFAGELSGHLYNAMVDESFHADGRLQLANQMVALGEANTNFQGFHYQKGVTPISGFRPALTANGQGADVYRHILFTAGNAMLGNVAGDAENDVFRAYDWAQAQSGRQESLAELADDDAGMEVGRRMLGTATAGVHADYNALKREIMGILCIN
jgi:hypothetical protein